MQYESAVQVTDAIDEQITRANSLFDVGFSPGPFGMIMAEGAEVTVYEVGAEYEIDIRLPDGCVSFDVAHDAVTLTRARGLGGPGFNTHVHPRWMLRTLKGAVWMLRRLNSSAFGDGTPEPGEQLDFSEIARLAAELKHELETFLTCLQGDKHS